MKVAIIHDWLVVAGGAEKVLDHILRCYPDADIYTLVDYLPKAERGFLGNANVTTSFIQKMPGARKHYRKYLSLFPLAVEQFDLSNYDLVISSSYAAAKGVITGPDQTHICYCHSPARYAWDLQFTYLKQSGLDRGLLSVFARLQLHYFRIWDYRTAAGVDHFLSNSNFIARRIRKCYNREAEVLYPPVEFNVETSYEPRGDFYLTASRMVPYKKIDLIVEAFNAMPTKKLVVIGAGPEFKKISAAAGPNVELLGYQPDAVLHRYMQTAKAFVFAAEEDFGIIPVEAQFNGTPVIAYKKGGSLETVIDGVTGILFPSQSTESLTKAVADFERMQDKFSAEIIREHARGFSGERFRRRLTAIVEEAMNR